MVEYLPRDFEGLDAGHRAVVRNNALSRDARLLFVILNSFASTKDGCYISNARLAFYMGCTPRAVQKWIEELKNAEAIIVQLIDQTKREIKIISKIQIGKKATHEQPCTGVCTDIHGGMNVRSGGYEQPFTQGSRVKGIEKRNGVKVKNTKKDYPYIAQAIKAEGSEAQRDIFFKNYAKWMAYFNSAQPTLLQMLDKLQREIEMKEVC